MDTIAFSEFQSFKLPSSSFVLKFVKYFNIIFLPYR